MSNVTSLAALREPQQTMPTTSVQAGFFDLQSFELMQRVAKGFASSTLVPQQYQGNVANTMIALSMAQRIGADPMAVMQQLYIVHGRPSWSSKFLIATFNACGRFTAMRFRFKGDEGSDDWSCQAYAIEKATSEEVNGSWVSIGMAKTEGWYGKNGSKWKTMPQQMLMYRAASFMVNVVAPELSMGIQTAEEAHDIIDVTPDSSGSYTVESLREPATEARVIARQDTDETSQSPTWPKSTPDGELVDARGVIWSEQHHASTRTCNADGSWRVRRGADPEQVSQYEARFIAQDKSDDADQRPSEPQAPSDELQQDQPAATKTEDETADAINRLRGSIMVAETADEVDDLLDYARSKLVLKQGQRFALESSADERKRQLAATERQGQ